MSYYLKNKGGRIVAVETEEEYKRWLASPGFSIPETEEVQTFVRETTKKWQDIQRRAIEINSPSIYMATVSQGGKDGYSIASGKMIQELRNLGVNIDLHNRGQKVGILFHAPYSLLRMENQFRILFTMFESTKLPDDWRDYLESADVILVPSKWCQKVFKEYGVDTVLVPLGYDPAVYTFHDRPVPVDENKDFVFVHYNAFNIRKGFMELWEAWNKAFRKDEPVKLILKTTVKNLPLPITPRQYPNVVIEQGEFDDVEMVKLLHNSHCFVFPSRGEGFGLTPLEAMATGIPAIIPNAHGITEYFNSSCMYEVKVKEWVPATYKRYMGQDVGQMAMCDVDDLVRQLRWVYEHQQEAKEKGKRAAEWVRQWTWAITAQKLADVIKKYENMPAEDRPIRNILMLEQVR